MAWKACKNRVTAGITELCEVRWWVPTDLRDRFSRTGALFLPIGHKSRHNGVAQTKKGRHAGRPIKTAILDGNCLGFLFFRRLVCRRRGLLRRRRCRVRCARHAFFEAADTFAQASSQLGNLPTSEQEQDNRQDYQPMNRTKLAHESPPRTICGALLTTLTQDASRGKCG